MRRKARSNAPQTGHFHRAPPPTTPDRAGFAQDRGHVGPKCSIAARRAQRFRRHRPAPPRGRRARCAANSAARLPPRIGGKGLAGLARQARQRDHAIGRPRDHLEAVLRQLAGEIAREIGAGKIKQRVAFPELPLLESLAHTARATWPRRRRPKSPCAKPRRRAAAAVWSPTANSGSFSRASPSSAFDRAQRIGRGDDHGGDIRLDRPGTATGSKRSIGASTTSKPRSRKARAVASLSGCGRVTRTAMCDFAGDCNPVCCAVTYEISE